MWYAAIVLLGVCILTIQSYLHSKERKDLYNRIMSRDLGEYQIINESPKTKLSLRRNYLKNNMRHAYRAMYGNDKTE